MAYPSGTSPVKSSILGTSPDSSVLYDAERSPTYSRSIPEADSLPCFSLVYVLVHIFCIGTIGVLCLFCLVSLHTWCALIVFAPSYLTFLYSISKLASLI